MNTKDFKMIFVYGSFINSAFKHALHSKPLLMLVKALCCVTSSFDVHKFVIPTWNLVWNLECDFVNRSSIHRTILEHSSAEFDFILLDCYLVHESNPSSGWICNPPKCDPCLNIDCFLILFSYASLIHHLLCYMFSSVAILPSLLGLMVSIGARSCGFHRSIQTCTCKQILS